MSRLKLEVNKIYVCRDGRLVKIVGTIDDHDIYKFRSVDIENGSHDFYTEDGYFFSHKTETQFDIIEEYGSATYDLVDYESQEIDPADERLLIKSSEW